MEHNEKIIGNAEELQYILPGRNFHSTWSSPEAFADYLSQHGPDDCWISDSAYDREDEDFTGTKTMDEALHLARNGWKEGAEKVEQLRSFIQNLYPKSPRYTRYGIAGTTPSVPRAVAGNILNMRLPESNKSKKRPVITLVCNMCANWTVDKEVLCNRAAAVTAVIDEIESAGFACEVIATALTSSGWKERRFTAATSVYVKRSHQPVDIMRMAFGLGHSAMFRRLVFADWQLESSCEDGLGGGLGCAHGAYSKEDLEKMHEKDIYFVPSAEECRDKFEDDLSSATEGLKFIIDSLRTQGCPAFKKMDLEDKDKVDLTDESTPDDDED